MTIASQRMLRQAVGTQEQAGQADPGRFSVAGVQQWQHETLPGSGATERPLPAAMRRRAEQLSGVPLGQVKVHYQSPEPAFLDAFAFARGADIHLAPGHERFLVHETWHAAQQRQGRVPARGRLHGMPLNQDRELEHEADQIASGGLDSAGSAPASRGRGCEAVESAAQGAPVVQRVRAHGSRHGSAGRSRSARDSSWLTGVGRLIQSRVNQVRSFGIVQRLLAGAVRYFPGIVGQMMPAIDERRMKRDDLIRHIESHAEKVRTDLDDEGDIDQLESLMKEARAIASKVMRHLQEALRHDERPQGQLVARGEEDSSEMAGRPSPRAFREHWLEKADEELASLRRKRDEILRAFAMSSGGFSARGRAHDGLGADVLAAGSPDPTDKVIDTTFFEGITLNGVQLSSQIKAAKTARILGSEKAGQIVVNGERIAQEALPTVDPSKHLADFSQNVRQLNSNGAGDWSKEFQDSPTRRDRGKGQFANMNQTNATGYAWLAGVPNWWKQRWEWLHVRGAGLGGETDGSNLVAGTRDANTHMIPFESNIRSLAGIAKEDDNYKNLRVDWSVIPSPKANAKHVVNRVEISWKLNKADRVQRVDEPHGKASFEPLRTDSNISKIEVLKIEERLKETRDQLQSRTKRPR